MTTIVFPCTLNTISHTRDVSVIATPLWHKHNRSTFLLVCISTLSQIVKIISTQSLPVRFRPLTTRVLNNLPLFYLKKKKAYLSRYVHSLCTDCCWSLFRFRRYRNTRKYEKLLPVPISDLLTSLYPVMSII